jgi:hypothetical protein
MIVNAKSGNFSKKSDPNRSKIQRKSSRSTIPTAIVAAMILRLAVNGMITPNAESPTR